MAVHNTSRLQSVRFLYIATAVWTYINFRWFPITTLFTVAGSAFPPVQHVQKSDIVEPTLLVTVHNLPYNSRRQYCVLKVTESNSTVFNRGLIVDGGEKQESEMVML